MVITIIIIIHHNSNEKAKAAFGQAKELKNIYARKV